MNSAPTYDLKASPFAVAAVRDFFRKHPEGEFVASWIGKVAGIAPLQTMKALAHLLEEGDIGVRVDAAHMSWTFYARGGRW